MRKEILTVRAKRSAVSETLGLIFTVRHVAPTYVHLVLGYPGLPNISGQMEAGDAWLYETATSGLFEARLLGFHFQDDTAQFLLTEVAPRLGLVAGAADIDPANAPFSDAQLSQVRDSIEDAKNRVARLTEMLPEQIALVQRKLDEVGQAATRMGRKDWVNYVAGSLTSLCITAAFAPDVTRKVFESVNASFVWLFASGILLLP